MAKIGTGHGRNEWSYVQTTRFERESATPNETDRDPLRSPREPVAMGILPPPSIARSPNPFPAWTPRFVPDPPRALTRGSGSPPIGPSASIAPRRGPLAYLRAMPAPAFAADARDEDLMLAYAAGDAAAFDALYARHKGGVYRYLLRHCGHAGIADELFQDVWMNVIRARAPYAPSAKLTTWLYRIAHNRLIDHWRATGQVELVTAGPDDDDGRSARRDSRPRATTSPRSAPARARSSDAAAAPRSPRCRAAQREAFLLHQEGGLELAEIAALTGAGVETVKSRIRYALAKLRAELGDLQ